MWSITERAVYGASMSAVPKVSLNSKIVGLLTLKRPEGRAPTSRQLVDAPYQSRLRWFLLKTPNFFVTEQRCSEYCSRAHGGAKLSAREPEIRPERMTDHVQKPTGGPAALPRRAFIRGVIAGGGLLAAGGSLSAAEPLAE